MTLATLTFDPALHEYRLEGRRVLSVTQILTLAGLGVNYATVPPAVLAHARARGEHVDACCDLLDAGNLDWDSVHPEAVPYVRAWQSFCDVEAFKSTASQVTVYDEELDVAGMLDARDVTRIVERKCTAKVADTYALQTAAYALAVRKEGYQPPIRWLVQLLPSGKYRLIDHDAEAARHGRDDFSAWRAAVALARWRLAGANGASPTGR